MRKGAGNKTVQVYNRLKHVLVFQKIPPRTRLDINDLAKRLGVSKTPVRDALIMLAEDEIIQAEIDHSYYSKPSDMRTLIEEYEMAFTLLERTIKTGISEIASSGVQAPGNLFIMTAQNTPNNVRPCADYLENLFEQIVASRKNTRFVRLIQSFNDRTTFIRQLHLQKPGQLILTDKSVTEFVESLKGLDTSGSLLILERQYRRIIDELDNLVNEANLIALNAAETWINLTLL